MARRTSQPADDYIAQPDEPLEVVLRHPDTGREIHLGVVGSLRDLEVLGSAGMHYAEKYDNPLRPPAQVQRRRERARRMGYLLWDAAVERCDIEDPGS
ncbi:MAG: hypothetical protein NVS3B12_19960 [Acidimicrobiales bacterium]